MVDQKRGLHANPQERSRTSASIVEKGTHKKKNDNHLIRQSRYRKPLKKPRKISRKLLIWFLNMGLWLLILLGILVVWFSYDLPSVKRLENVTRKPSVTLLARDGSVMATFGDLYGSFVEVQDLPAHVPGAIMAIEDRRFFYHFGIDFLGILRAAWVNYRSGRVIQGGSTLTQQLAKNFLLSEKLYEPTNRSLRRKIQEVLLALWLEHKFSKMQILTIYLNRVYLGAGVYGIDAAAQKYFSKPAKKLDVYEAAVIAGLLKAPSRYSPLTNPELAHQRGQIVLEAMAESGFITPQQKASSYQQVSEPFKNAPQKALVGRYFADWIFEHLDEYIKIEDDVVVQTTLDLRLQKLAEEKTSDILFKEGDKLNIHQGALVAMTPDGGVRALVGGIDYRKSQFNRATQARRQMGSSFKFFTFLCALEHGYTPSSMVDDTLVRIGKWQPKNYKYKSRGEINLTDAFAYSANAVAVRLASRVGLKQMTQMTQRLGVTSPQPRDMTISLGSGEATLLELTAAYATIANHGFGVWPYGIVEIKTTREGKILFKRKSQGAGRIVKSKTVLNMLELMKAAFTYGTGKAAHIGRPCAGKTGTSQNYRDAWSIGFTPDLVTGVWLGNDDGAYMKSITGGKTPAQIWHAFMAEAHAPYAVHYFPGIK